MLGNDVVSTKDCLPILLKDREVGGVKKSSLLSRLRGALAHNGALGVEVE